MAADEFNTLEGKLEIASRPSTLCFGKPLEFLENLTKYLRVSFPIFKTHKFVLVDTREPDVDDVDKLWARFDSAGNPQGWFAFIKGQWQRFYTVVPGEVRWVVGDSDNPPAGWQPIVEESGYINPAILTELMTHYVEISAGRYSFFAVRYVGY